MQHIHTTAMNWDWPEHAMSFLHCCGWVWLGLLITVERLANQFFYERICRRFQSAKNQAASSEATTLLGSIVRVFRLCGWCGYGLMAFAIVPYPLATFVYWADAILMLWLVKESYGLDKLLGEHGAERIFERLDWAEQIEGVAREDLRQEDTNIDRSSLHDAVEQRIALMRGRNG